MKRNRRVSCTYKVSQTLMEFANSQNFYIYILVCLITLFANLVRVLVEIGTKVKASNLSKKRPPKEPEDVSLRQVDYPEVEQY